MKSATQLKLNSSIKAGYTNTILFFKELHFNYNA